MTGVLREFMNIMRRYRGLVVAGMGGMLSARALRMRVSDAKLGKEARGYPFGVQAGGLSPQSPPGLIHGCVHCSTCLLSRSAVRSAR